MTDQPVTQKELAEVLMVVVIETMDAISPDASIVDQRLENIASRLLNFVNAMQAGNSRDILASLAKNLIQTEGPAQAG